MYTHFSMNQSFADNHAGVVCAFAVMSFASLISLTILQYRVNLETASIINHSLVLTDYSVVKRVRSKPVAPVAQTATPENTTH